MAVSDDQRRRPPGFLQVLRRQPAHAGTGVIDHGTERLIDLMGNRGRHLAKRCHPRDVHQLHLCLVQCRFGAFALGQVEHERDALVLPALEHGGADQDRHATAVFADIFLLERCAAPGGGQLRQRLFVGRTNVSGVPSRQLTRPATRSSRSYPTRRRKASLASRI